jgi:hypothetical protein
MQTSVLRCDPGLDTPRGELATVKFLRRLADGYDTGLIGAQPLRRGVRRMRTPEVDCIGAPPHPEGLEEVRRWRHDYACRLGFDEPEAALIAHRAEIDTHVLERLIQRGCSPDLALEIAR